MNLSINSVVYFYIFICIALLVFNILYILRSEGQGRREQHRTERWNRLLDRQTDPDCTPKEARAHQALLRRRLRRVPELSAYNAALEGRLGLPETQRYLDAGYESYQELALVYQHRPAMERAFYAYLIARWHPRAADGGGQLPVILLTYLDDSTVYCRENVLQALYALGNAGAVEQALHLFNEQGWYHHERMLSDGLSTFAGDCPALARQLWSISRNWNENLRVAVVQFASNVTDDLKEPFRQALADRGTPLEVRFALIRYFIRRPDPAVKPLLLELAAEDVNGDGPAIAACTALARYPGPDTEAVLDTALRSRNWYVRHNAASSLAALGYAEAAYAAAEANHDRYAKEMLDYVTGRSTHREVTV